MVYNPPTNSSLIHDRLNFWAFFKYTLRIIPQMLRQGGKPVVQHPAASQTMDSVYAQFEPRLSTPPTWGYDLLPILHWRMGAENEVEILPLMTVSWLLFSGLLMLCKCYLLPTFFLTRAELTSLQWGSGLGCKLVTASCLQQPKCACPSMWSQPPRWQVTLLEG